MQNNCITFQSTPSAWRETCRHRQDRCCQRISIHSLRMEGDWQARRAGHRGTAISIHSLRMEGDSLTTSFLISPFSYFNPLPPHGGRRRVQLPDAPQFHFNPLPPHGGRLSISCMDTPSFSFQSTPSAWRETRKLYFNSCSCGHFNPLPPHGGRPFANAPASCSLDFNPLPPHGGRP